jgi:hypothetical protein
LSYSRPHQAGTITPTAASRASVENLSSSRYRLQTRRAIVGALVGGFLFDLFGASGVTGLNIYSMIVAVVGSVVVLLIYNTVMGRRRA